jgi:leader peptidase (prepilin peptidase)/N-methyltransferase
MELGLFILFAVPITIFDLKEFRIPDALTIGGILLFFVIRLLAREEPFLLLCIECFTGFGFFWLVRFLTKGRLGLGDAKYSAFIAVSAGLYPWFAALFIACAAGLAAAAIPIVFFKADRGMRIPFAPFLSIGGAGALCLKGLSLIPAGIGP